MYVHTYKNLLLISRDYFVQLFCNNFACLSESLPKLWQKTNLQTFKMKELIP